jgi:hypothetical protein
MAPNSGRASVRPNRPGAASPAGWLPPPAGEAAPSVRLREPARSDGASPYDMETRPTSVYRVPWQSARADRTRHPLRRPQTPMARPQRGAPDDPASRGTPPDPWAGAPDMRWPSLTRRGPRRIPVVGPTEALRGRVGSPGVNVPRGVVPGLLDQERQSGWQLAQRAWQESGVNWDDAPEADDYLDDKSPDRDLTDPHPTRPDLPVLPAPADSRLGMGPWPVQQPVRYAFASSSPFAPSSPFALSPAFASPHSFGASPAPGTPPSSATVPLSAPVAPASPPLGEADELFRAWQGSVREAAGQRAPWSARRPGKAGLRGRGLQVAKIGVPAAVIVTVGAGALLMLTGRANGMLAERSSTGALSSGQPGTGAVSSARASGKAVPSGQAGAPGQPGAGPAGLALAGYPGGHGSVGVAALWSAGGTTMAVGAADAHPAVWRHASDGTWSLVSATALGGLTGHLTSVAQGPSGWIAVGSMNENGTVEPVVFRSADGVTWAQLPALTNLAGGDAQFLGVAAGPGGYLVVGKQGSGAGERAAFWWSGDLQSWVSGSGMGAPSYAAAAVAIGDGFVAVGSMANCHTIWLSSDGQHWTEHDLAKPSGATTATLRSIAAEQSGRFVAAGVAGGAADIPIVVTSADGGAHVTSLVLSAPQGPASVTAVTATSDGFVAVGLAGQANARHAVEWTSPDGLTWSAATVVAAAGASEITALTDSGAAVTGTAQQGSGPSVLAIPAG